MLRAPLSMLSALLLSIPSTASALLVNLSSTTESSTPGRGIPVEITLDPGTYMLLPIDPSSGGTFTAWNAWSYVSGCDVNGENCSTGWLSRYAYESPSLGFTCVN